MNKKSNDSDRKTSYQILQIICTQFIIEVICQDRFLLFLCDATPKASYHLLESDSCSDDPNVCDLKQFLYNIPGCECAFYI